MNKKAFLVIVFSMFISMLAFGIVAPLLPIYADNLGASGLEIGIMFAAFGIAHAIFLPFVGRLSDRIGRKILLCSGLLSLTVVSVGFIWVQNTLQLIIIRSLQGIATTMHLPIAQAYVGDIIPEGEEGRWMGHFNAALFFGMGIGPLFGGILTDLFNINTTFITMAALTLVGLIVTITLLPEVKGGHIDKKQTMSFSRLRKSNIMKGLFTYRLVVGIGSAALMTFLPIFAHRNLSLNISLIGILLASRAAISLLQSFSGKLADKYNRKALVITGGLIGLTFIALVPTATNFWTLLVIHALAAVGVALSMPAATAFMVEEGRISGMGATMATFMMAMMIGNGIGPIVIGEVVDLWGIESAFYSGGAISLVGVGLFAWFTRNYSQEKITSRRVS